MRAPPQVNCQPTVVCFLSRPAPHVAIMLIMFRVGKHLPGHCDDRRLRSHPIMESMTFCGVPSHATGSASAVASSSQPTAMPPTPQKVMLPSNRVVPSSWSSPVPNAGPWLGHRPAAPCEEGAVHIRVWALYDCAALHPTMCSASACGTFGSFRQNGPSLSSMKRNGVGTINSTCASPNLRAAGDYPR
jgi:hypothetical protein